MTEPEPTRPAASSSAPWVFARSALGCELRFTGRGFPAAAEALALLAGVPTPALAMARQVHSAHVLRARPGNAGEGDALVSDAADLALAIVTADCVPVLLIGPDAIGAAHAGWRGLAAGVLPATVASLGRVDLAWIGPAIGPCCYEVGAEVAHAVSAASAPEVLVPGSRDRPHLDLWMAAGSQLRSAGVRTVETVRLCTRCHPRLLWSYRRDGASAGRNLALLWRSGARSRPQPG